LGQSWLHPPSYHTFASQSSSSSPPGTSGIYKRTGLPVGDHVLRVVAVDPVRNETAVIRNRIRVREASTFCVVVGTNAGLTVGRNNNVTVEFTGTGVTTGFQCIMDRQEPYFDCKWTSIALSAPLQDLAYINGQHPYCKIPNENSTLIYRIISSATLGSFGRFTSTSI